MPGNEQEWIFPEQSSLHGHQELYLPNVWVGKWVQACGKPSAWPRSNFLVLILLSLFPFHHSFDRSNRVRSFDFLLQSQSLSHWKQTRPLLCIVNSSSLRIPQPHLRGKHDFYKQQPGSAKLLNAPQINLDDWKKSIQSPKVKTRDLNGN